MTRQEHLEWYKTRALEYVDKGNCQEAITSMISDLGRHDEIHGHAGIQLGMELIMMGQLSSPEEARKFIEGFN